ncbi:MAG: hypothetical protein RQ826_00755 [Xanthomonadales bacterium]|nr:hypothetical protein [Xanthomonadales bacterium]
MGSILLFLAWQLSSARVEPGADELRDQVGFLSDEVAALSLRLERAQARSTVLQREVDVVRRANRILRDQESARQAELGRLQGELDFYRRLVGTGGSQPGLAVYEAEILPTESSQVFQFVLTLTQNTRRASIISGELQLEIEGTLDDQPLALDWERLRQTAASETRFRFKYFQQVEGFLSLPAGFSPLRVRVTLHRADSKEPIRQEYRWKDLLANPQSAPGPAPDRD